MAACFCLNPYASILETDRQAPSAHAIAVDDDDALLNIVWGQRFQNPDHGFDDRVIFPIAFTKEKETWIACLRERKQARIIEIGRDYRPLFFFRAVENFEIGRAMKT